MYDAVLLIGFGGPTCMDEVRPFLADVARGRGISAERLETVVHHYERIGGKSPFNELTLRQAAALEAELRAGGMPMPVYVGLRSWHPYLRETLARMGGDGVRRALGLIMAPQQNDAGWYRYQRDTEAARAQVGAAAPRVDYAGEWHAHPLFIDAEREIIAPALAASAAGLAPEQAGKTFLIFTAHSIPVAMAKDSPYVEQIIEAAGKIAAAVGHPHWVLAYQSRSGRPTDPWLAPDVCDVIRTLAADRVRRVVVAPIGFVCDHVEVLYDLDIEAQQVATEVGVEFVRASTVNDHPQFIRMLADVVRRSTHA